MPLPFGVPGMVASRPYELGAAAGLISGFGQILINDCVWTEVYREAWCLSDVCTVTQAELSAAERLLAAAVRLAR
eukprot:1214794-Pyramimonas_sp.AAC.1